MGHPPAADRRAAESERLGGSIDGATVARRPDIQQMQRQATAIFARVEADQRADDLMYQLGRLAGDEAGYRRGETDEAARWCWAFGLLRRVALGPSHAELVRRRAA